MQAEPFSAIEAAETMLDRYWDGNLPVNVEAFAESEGITIREMNRYNGAKWRSDLEEIVLDGNMSGPERRECVALALGEACSVDPDEFAFELLAPRRAGRDREETANSMALKFGLRKAFAEKIFKAG